MLLRTKHSALWTRASRLVSLRLRHAAEEGAMLRLLEGIRVLDFTWFQQGPYATVVLSDLGAEIIKLEARGHGDPGRGVAADAARGLRPYFIAHDRGKKSVTLDLKRPEAQEIVFRLV